MKEKILKRVKIGDEEYDLVERRGPAALDCQLCDLKLVAANCDWLDHSSCAGGYFRKVKSNKIGWSRLFGSALTFFQGVLVGVLACNYDTTDFAAFVAGLLAVLTAVKIFRGEASDA